MDENSWHQLAFSTAMDFAKETIKGCILINGGAAAGLVTFLPSAKTAGLRIESLAAAAISFGWGTLFGVMAFGLSYVAQVYIAEAHPASEKQLRVFSLWRYSAVAAALFSGIAFLIGLYLAAGSVAPITMP